MIQVRCRCGKTLAFKDQYAGKRFRCPYCDNEVHVPDPADAATPGDPPPVLEPYRPPPTPATPEPLVVRVEIVRVNLTIRDLVILILKTIAALLLIYLAIGIVLTVLMIVWLIILYIFQP